MKRYLCSAKSAKLDYFNTKCAFCKKTTKVIYYFFAPNTSSAEIYSTSSGGYVYFCCPKIPCRDALHRLYLELQAV